MSKAVTVSDIRELLREALKPIAEDINYLKQKSGVNDNQIVEINRMINAISIKLDAVEQTTAVASKPPVKRTKKPKADEKSNIKAADDEDDEKSKPRRKVPTSSADPDDDEESVAHDDAAPEEVDVDEDDEVSSTTSESKKKSVNKVKSSGSSTRTKASSDSKSKKSTFNKLVQFRKVFNTDEKRVTDLISEEAVTKLESSVSEHRGAAKKTARVKAYYDYVCKNNPAFFTELKNEYDK
jgi:hypothetical protein